jgi:intracellular multiplication protein IcmG
MLAKQGSDETRSVSVGDTLPGIGRITSIAEVGGLWRVSGTSGHVSQ